MTIKQRARGKRRIIAAMLAAVLCLALPCGSLAAQNALDAPNTESNDFRYTVNPDGKSAAITWFVNSGHMTEVNVPDTINGFAVTAIADHAFDLNFELERITLPDTVTEISSFAFSVEPGEHGMSFLEALSSIEVAPGNAVYASKDGVLFDRCANMLHTYPPGKQGETYTVPEGITSIAANAFRGSYVTRVTLPDSLKEIGDDALRGSGLSEITIPAGVTSIGPGAFSCHDLSAIQVAPQNSVYTATDGVLFDLTQNMLHTYPRAKADDAYAVPKGIACIARRAFAACDTLSEVTLPDTVIEIGDEAFRSCKALETISLPDNLREIGGYAFGNCSALARVAIPKSVTYIGGGAFYYMESLAAIDVDPDNPIYTSVDGVLIDKHNRTLHTYPKGKEDEVYAVPDGIVVIADYAFFENENVFQITMPDTVITIGESAFEGCTHLEEITLSESLAEIGEWAFWFCFSLDEITLPASLTHIGENVFDMTTIYVSTDTYAHQYAEENEMVTFIVIEEE